MTLRYLAIEIYCQYSALAQAHQPSLPEEGARAMLHSFDHVVVGVVTVVPAILPALNAGLLVLFGLLRRRERRKCAINFTNSFSGIRVAGAPVPPCVAPMRRRAR